MIKMLKSDNAENEERQIARLKKEIERLTNELQKSEQNLEKFKNKKSSVEVVGIANEPEVAVTAEVLDE
jgi:molecular chaperone GrpE (heat shock protein)